MGTFLISEACEHNTLNQLSHVTLFSAAACWHSWCCRLKCIMWNCCSCRVKLNSTCCSWMHHMPLKCIMWNCCSCRMKLSSTCSSWMHHMYKWTRRKKASGIWAARQLFQLSISCWMPATHSRATPNLVAEWHLHLWSFPSTILVSSRESLTSILLYHLSHAPLLDCSRIQLLFHTPDASTFLMLPIEHLLLAGTTYALQKISNCSSCYWMCVAYCLFSCCLFWFWVYIN